MTYTLGYVFACLGLAIGFSLLCALALIALDAKRQDRKLNRELNGRKESA